MVGRAQMAVRVFHSSVLGRSVVVARWSDCEDRRRIADPVEGRAQATSLAWPAGDTG